MTQPTALRLADALDDEFYQQGRISNYNGREAAAELRRLHQLALDQQGEIYGLQMARSMEQKTATLKQAALLGALQNIERSTYDTMTATLARAAIAKAEGEKA